MTEPVRVDGQLIIDLLKALGVEDWKAVTGTTISIDPPGHILATQLVRNEKGQFYRDPESPEDPAQRTFLGSIQWP